MIKLHSTSHRFLIAICLPPSLELSLRHQYLSAYQVPCPVRTLHSTLIPPFTLLADTKPSSIMALLHQLPAFNQSFEFGNPGIFEFKSRQVLYLELLPVSPLQTLYDSLIKNSQSLIQIDTQDFNHHQLPKFLPHLTLNYDFTQSPQAFVPPPESFHLPRPSLLIEMGPGIWQPYAV